MCLLHPPLWLKSKKINLCLVYPNVEIKRSKKKEDESLYSFYLYVNSGSTSSCHASELISEKTIFYCKIRKLNLNL